MVTFISLVLIITKGARRNSRLTRFAESPYNKVCNKYSRYWDELVKIIPSSRAHCKRAKFFYFLRAPPPVPRLCGALPLGPRRRDVDEQYDHLSRRSDGARSPCRTGALAQAQTVTFDSTIVSRHPVPVTE